MADATTSRYLLVNPEVGASSDTWGSKLNANFTSIDKLMGAITTTGSANAYVLTSGQSLTAYVDGQSFFIKASFGNTGGATLNVDSIGAKNLRKLVAGTLTALASGDISTLDYLRVTYNSANDVFVIGATLTGVWQPLDAMLTAIAGLTSADDRMLDFTGSDTVAVVTYATVRTNITAVDLSADNLYTDTAWVIAANTSDGADSSTVTLAGGGTGGAARGASLLLTGNEAGASGAALLTSGTAGGVTITGTTGISLVGATTATSITGPPAASSETTGALTVASANKVVKSTGNTSIAQNVFTAGDTMLIYAGSAARTLTQTSGTQRLHGSATTGNLTLAARGIASLYFISATEWVCSGDVS